VHVSELAESFSERQAYWVGQGYIGRSVFEQLATDTELPAQFGSKDVSAIVGLGESALTQRRFKKMQPGFIRVSGSHVRYPRESICYWLADMYNSHDAAA